MNRLLFGDNLAWLRDRGILPDESVDLVYLDPPFNSNATYNVLFREESGEASRAQFHAFTDTWHWADAEPSYRDFLATCTLGDAVEVMEAFHDFLKTSQMMAYLAMMAPRLVELHRVLKSTGSIYLHCDPTASHYLKILMDAIFDPRNFQAEITWRRTGTHSDAKRWSPVADILLHYAKSGAAVWNPIYAPLSKEYVATKYRYRDPDGRRYRLDNMTSPKPRPNMMYTWKGFPSPPLGWRFSKETMAKLDRAHRIVYPKSKTKRPQLKRYLDKMKGVLLGNVWTDIDPINSRAIERLGYQTQKPEPLLERIITASSNEGAVVLDPFCGCGTSISVAQRLRRQWIGIDITYLAINLIKRRLDKAFGKGAVAFSEMGQPTDLAGARRLAELDRFQFQQWALNLVDAVPRRGGSGRGADRGVDGLLYFYEAKDERRRILVQVKSGAVERGDVTRLLGDARNHKAVGGILITLDNSTPAMRKEEVEAGRYTSALWRRKDYPQIQILTVDGLLSGKERPDMPPADDPFSAPERAATAEQGLLRESREPSPPRGPVPEQVELLMVAEPPPPKWGRRRPRKSN